MQSLICQILHIVCCDTEYGPLPSKRHLSPHRADPLLSCQISLLARRSRVCISCPARCKSSSIRPATLPWSRRGLPTFQSPLSCVALGRMFFAIVIGCWSASPHLECAFLRRSPCCYASRLVPNRPSRAETGALGYSLRVGQLLSTVSALIHTPSCR